MSIEFHCPHCDKALRTSDDRAGQLVRCPHCGKTMPVPRVSGGVAIQPDPVGPMGVPFESSPAAAPAPAPPLRPIPLEAGEVISTSWAIYKTQFAMLIAAVLIVSGVTVAVSMPGSILNFVAQNNRGNRDVRAVLALVQVPLSIVSSLVQIFLTIGQTKYFLKIARGEPADLGELFRGGHYFLRALGASILFGLMLVIGFVLLVVPGIIVALMFWPFMFVLVDIDPPGMQCLSRARAITQGTWGSIALLWLASLGVYLLGFAACCIGVIFTIPLAMMFYAVAYCRMTGQPTARILTQIAPAPPRM